ncbi:2-hydroxyacid dehydrogenase [Falsiroseomonas sp. CW058]|uniref:2-hydroxyacid dehydrogenase n=1 Tax=Falsiroseomonas sp. CW058 TaxID=3388664 RepID=UPI003D30F1B3
MSRPILLVKSGGEAAMPEWQRHFAEHAPGVEVRWWDDPAVDPAAVRYALVWDPEPGRLAGLPNLRVIFGSGAGVDFITADPDLPKGVPLARMATAGAAQRMGEYVTWAVLSLLRGARRIGAAQAERRWDYFEPERIATGTTVGIMGLGHMGQAAARMLQGVGFRVTGWSRSPKDMPGIRSFAGMAERDAFLAGADIIVCLLPATPETRGVISAPLFDRMRDGTGLVNAGRGSHQRIEDILAALDSGRLSGAVLDVFDQEPLPPDHPAWTHPKLLVTPHVASLPPRGERAAHVGALIAMHERGEPLPNLYDHARGY